MADARDAGREPNLLCRKRTRPLIGIADRACSTERKRRIAKLKLSRQLATEFHDREGAAVTASIKFVSMATEAVRAYQAGAPDSNGQVPETHVSDGDGVPCRHCQRDVAAGETYLILNHRPFPGPQPYAETGPIFLHADACPRYPAVADLPPVFATRKLFLIKGYNAADRIVYGTGQLVPPADLVAAAAAIFARDDVAYIHARSAYNNCFQCRIERA